MRGTHPLSRPSLARRWITALALLAFFFQGLAVQTHVHRLLQPAVVKALAGGTHKAPPKPEPVDQCRLCQELVHAGQFLAPATIAALADQSFVAAIFATLPSDPDRSATAFSWNSRAPPRR